MLSLPTFHEVVFDHQKRADGTYNVKIRVTFKREIRYLPTTVVVDRPELTRGMKIKNQAKVDALELFKRQLRDAVATVNIFELDAMNVDDVIKYVQNYLIAHRDFKLDFFEYGRKIAAEKPEHSGDNYRTALRDFALFMKTEQLDISEITSSVLRNYEQSIRARLGNSARAVSLYTSSIAHIHRRAREEFNNEELNQIFIKNPYQYYTPAAPPESLPRAVDLSVIRKMVETRPELSGRMRVSVDVFLLSFCLMGMNIPDLYEAAPPVDDVIVYNRHKTRTRRKDHAEAHVRLESWAKEFAKDYLSADKEHAFRFFAMFANYEGMGNSVDKGLKKWREKYNQPYVTAYSARHTWGTTAYAAGMNPAHITDGLVHRDPGRRMDEIYAQKSWDLIFEENRKVLDYAFNTETKAKED